MARWGIRLRSELCCLSVGSVISVSISSTGCNGNFRGVSRVVRVSGKSLEYIAPKGAFYEWPTLHIIDGRFTNKEKGHHYHQQRSKHEAQHPRWRHVMG